MSAAIDIGVARALEGITLRQRSQILQLLRDDGPMAGRLIADCLPWYPRNQIYRELQRLVSNREIVRTGNRRRYTYQLPE